MIKMEVFIFLLYLEGCGGQNQFKNTNSEMEETNFYQATDCYRLLGFPEMRALSQSLLFTNFQSFLETYKCQSQI